MKEAEFVCLKSLSGEFRRLTDGPLPMITLAGGRPGGPARRKGI
jgi:hypothetical protein